MKCYIRKLKGAVMLESRLERKMTDFVRKCGGRSFKWVCPGRVGVPDRIFIFPGGVIIFAEIKRPGRNGGRSPQQVKCQSILLGLGCNVMPEVNSMDKFKKELKERFGINGI